MTNFVMSKFVIIMISETLKNQRTNLGLKIQEMSSNTGIDQALLSKYESGKRNPSENHIIALADGYKIPLRQLRRQMLAEKIANLVMYEDNVSEIFMVAESRVAYLSKEELRILDELKKEWQKNRPLNRTQLTKLKEYFALKYTYDSNRIEGNTLSLQETQLVVKEGVTISGKSMREHLEAINHSEAIDFLEDLILNKESLDKRSILDLHRLILKTIDSENAGVYRKVPVSIGGSEYMPPQPFLLEKMMEDYFIHYNRQRKYMHPVILAAEMHERLVSIHPFLTAAKRHFPGHAQKEPLKKKLFER
ncbi:MAG: DNA-binding protein [Flavobacteriaceae bacterium]|nr:MAG: DNA-binding protein [Flavobacteriaceae bacterium]